MLLYLPVLSNNQGPLGSGCKVANDGSVRSDESQDSLLRASRLVEPRIGLVAADDGDSAHPC